jgi:hypothetical protein
MSEPAVLPEPRRPARCRAATRVTWADRLRRFANSGLSPAAFCAPEGVSLPSFYSWKRRLAAEGSAAEMPSGQDHGPRLLPVRLQPASAPVELVLPNGAVLRIGPECDLGFVQSLVQVLGGGPC